MSVPTGGRDAANRQAAYAAALVDEWVRGGVREAVVCPGSRSAPLALALAADDRIAVRVRLDERSAGFVALGLGLGTGRPAVVVTTSGTAAAELHPAVVEADLARVPLLVCTADRPVELHDVGAPQTIDQAGLFGPAVRWECDPGAADGGSSGWWRSVGSRSVAEATAGPRGPGPVHLNLPFREPLVGDPRPVGGVEPGRPAGLAWHAVPVPLAPPTEAMVSLLTDGGPPARGLIVAGAGCGDRDAVLALARGLGWPVLADPCSGVRVDQEGVVSMADPLVRSKAFVEEHRPEAVLRLGTRWASRAVNAYLADAGSAGARVWVVDPHGGWSDPERSADAVLRCDPTELCRRVLEQIASSIEVGPGEWWTSWNRAEARARAALAASIGSGTLDEPALAHRLFAALPGDANLVVSSSMPIRDLESFAVARPAPPRVLANRGANGIDGVVSTAQGVALGTGAPTVALVGDLAFFHDVSALVGPEARSLPLTVVIADNRGGGIFSFLEQATLVDRPTFEQLFATPQDLDPVAVATGFGWPAEAVDGSDGRATEAFDDALRARVSSGSASVLVVRSPDREGNVVRHRALFDALAGAGGPPPVQQGRGS